MKKKTFKKLLFFFASLGAILSFLSFKAVASIDQESFQDLGFITAGEYASFLNQEAVLDLDGFYDEKMSLEEGSIRRLGEPGSYYYEVALGKEFQPVCFLNHHMMEYYALWKGMDIHASAFLQADQELKINHETSTLPVMEMAGERIIATTVWQRLLKFLFVTSLLANSRGQMLNEDQPIVKGAAINNTGESFVQQENRIERGNLSGPVVFGENVMLHYHDLEPALGEFEQQGKDLAEVEGKIEELHQLKSKKQAKELEKKKGVIRQAQLQLAAQIQEALTKEALALRERIKQGKKEALPEGAQWCYSYEIVNRQLHRYGGQNNIGIDKKVTGFHRSHPFYLLCPDIENLLREEERLRFLEEALRSKEADLGGQNAELIALRNQRSALQQEQVFGKDPFAVDHENLLREKESLTSLEDTLKNKEAALGEQNAVLRDQRSALQQEQAFWDEEKTTLLRKITLWEFREKKQKIDSLVQEALERGKEINDLLKQLKTWSFPNLPFSLWSEVDKKVEEINSLWDKVIMLLDIDREKTTNLRAHGETIRPWWARKQHAYEHKHLWYEKIAKHLEERENSKYEVAKQSYVEVQEKDQALQQAELLTGERTASFWEKALEEAKRVSVSWVDVETVFQQRQNEVPWQVSHHLKNRWEKDFSTIQENKAIAVLRVIFYEAQAKDSLLKFMSRQAAEAHQQRFYDQAIEFWDKFFAEIDALLRAWKEFKIEAEGVYWRVSLSEKRRITAFTEQAEQAETFWGNQVVTYKNQKKESHLAQNKEEIKLRNFQTSLRAAENESAFAVDGWNKIKTFPEEDVLNELVALAKQASDCWNKVLSFKSHELPYYFMTNYEKNSERALRKKKSWDRKIQRISNTTIAAHAIRLGKAAVDFAQVAKGDHQLKIEAALKGLSTEVDQFTNVMPKTTRVSNNFLFEPALRKHLKELHTKIQENLEKGFPCTYVGMIVGGGLVFLEDTIENMAKAHGWEWSGGPWDACSWTRVQRSILSLSHETATKIVKALKLAAKLGWKNEEVWLTTLLQQIADFSERITKNNSHIEWLC